MEATLIKVSHQNLYLPTHGDQVNRKLTDQLAGVWEMVTAVRTAAYH
jgi:hypothetical protein